MARKYSIYRITSPSGKCYVGLTGMSVSARWNAHVRKALGTTYSHPFYNAIRKYGAHAFSVEVLQTHLTKVEAQSAERRHISSAPPHRRYNLSPGGEADGGFGSAKFWREIRQDKAKLSEYLQRLSQTKMSRDWSDYEGMSQRAQAWRKQNPKQAYAASRRASRIAAKVQALARELISGAARPQPIPTLKDRLRAKHAPGRVRSAYVTAVWEARDPDERRRIGAKISAATKATWATIPCEARAAMTANARAAIDRDKQGRAASTGLKQFWATLKADPVRYAEYMASRTASRTASLMKTITKKTAQENESVG